MEPKFSPDNVVIKLCMSGMSLEENGDSEGAASMLQKAWDEATDDYERFIAAYHFARVQKDITDRLKWLKTSLQCALNINDENVKSAYPTLYSNIARCYEELSQSCKGSPSDKGPFYHGTKADLKIGDYLVAGGISNYKPGLKMNHIYFTANVNGAALAAALAKGEGRERVYIIEPTGEFENDPNVTDKKFPGNLTRSYRSHEPLRIIGEETEWTRPADQQKWRENLAKNEGEIIN